MITASGIVPRLDELNNKATKKNNRLELMCKKSSLPHISPCETSDPNKHWNEIILISILMTLEFLQNIFYFLSKSN